MNFFKTPQRRIFFVLILFVGAHAGGILLNAQRFVALGMVPGPEQFQTSKQVNIPPGGWKGSDWQLLHLHLPQYFHEKKIKTFSDFSDSELKEIREMGFNALWVMGAWMKSPLSKDVNLSYEDPQMPGRMASLFSIYDYQIDPEMGGEAAFVDFVARARNLGIKIVLDFVPTHLSPDTPVLTAHHELFQQADPRLIKAKPKGGAGYFKRTLKDGEEKTFRQADDNHFFMEDTAAFDLMNPETWLYLEKKLELLAHLTKSGGARIDMLTELHPETLREKRLPDLSLSEVKQKLNEISRAAFGEAPENSGAVMEVVIKRVKEKYPEFILIGENYQGQEAFWQAVGIDLTHSKFIYDWLFTRSQNGLKSFKKFLLRKEPFQYVPDEFLKRSIYFLENHDQKDRAIKKIEKSGRRNLSAEEIKQKARLKMVSIATIPGAVSVYWGQFQGRGKSMPSATWFDRGKEEDDQEMILFYKKLLRMTQHPVFRRGEFREIPFLIGENESCLAFARIYDGRVAIVVLNSTPRPARLELDFEKAGLDMSRPAVDLPPWGWHISAHEAKT